MLKGDIITAAFSRARISGLTRTPSPEDTAMALDRLEDMAAMWSAKSLNTGYAFEDNPDPNTPHNVPRKYLGAYKANLAMQILADFGKEIPASLVAEAAGALSSLFSSTAKVTEVPYPGRMPIGSGNFIRTNKVSKFFPRTELVSAITLQATEVIVYSESYAAYLLQDETVSAYTIASSNTSIVTVSNDVLTSPDLTFNLTAVALGSTEVTIKATTSLGRVDIRRINIVVEE